MAAEGIIDKLVAAAGVAQHEQRMVLGAISALMPVLLLVCCCGYKMRMNAHQMTSMPPMRTLMRKNHELVNDADDQDEDVELENDDEHCAARNKEPGAVEL